MSTTINIRNAREPILDNITFSSEIGDTPTDVVIHADVTYGYANTLRSLTGAFDFPANTFPAGWTVVVGGRTSPSVVPRQLAAENWTLTLPVTAVAAGVVNWGNPAFNAARWMGVERASSGAQNAALVEREPLRRHLDDAPGALEGTQPRHL